MRTKTRCDCCGRIFHQIHFHKGSILCTHCYRAKSNMTHFNCVKCKNIPIQDFNLSGLCPKCWQKEYVDRRNSITAVSRDMYRSQE